MAAAPSSMLSAATRVTVSMRSDDGQDVQEGPRVRGCAPEDLRTGVEDQNEDDEDEQDDPDDHSGAKSTIVRHDRPTRGVHVDLAHLEPPRAKSLVSLASSVPPGLARSYSRPLCGSARSVIRGSPPSPAPSASAGSAMRSRVSHYPSSSST